jgi:hypothetical protein
MFVCKNTITNIVSGDAITIGSCFSICCNPSANIFWLSLLENDVLQILVTSLWKQHTIAFMLSPFTREIRNFL